MIAGEARVSFLPTATAHGSELGVVSGYWAPTSQLGAERAELASIGGCFGLQAGTLSRFVKDQSFGYTLPLGWTVGNEGPDELFLDAGTERVSELPPRWAVPRQLHGGHRRSRAFSSTASSGSA